MSEREQILTECKAFLSFCHEPLHLSKLAAAITHTSRRFSQKAVAQAFDVSPQYINDVIAKRRQPTNKLAIPLSFAIVPVLRPLGMTIEEFAARLGMNAND